MKKELPVRPVFRRLAAVKNGKANIFHRNKYCNYLFQENVAFCLPSLQSVHLGDVFRIKQWFFSNLKIK